MGRSPARGVARLAAQLLQAFAEAGEVGIEAERVLEARDGVVATFIEEKRETEFGVEAGVVGDSGERALVVNDGFGEAAATRERGGPGALDEGILGVECERFFEMGLGGGGFFELFQGAGESQVGQSGVRIGGEGVAEVGGGVGGLASAEKRETHFDLCGRKVGAEFGGAPQVSERFVGAAEFGEGEREAEMRVGIVGERGQHGFEVNERSGGKTGAEIGEALAKKRFAVGRLLGDGGGEVRSGLVAAMLFQEGEPEAETREGIARVEFEDALEAGDGFGDLVATILDGGEREERGGVGRIERERAAGFGLRFLDTPVAEKRISEKSVGGVAIRADFGGVAKEGNGIAPDGLLVPRANDAAEQDDARGDAGEDAGGGSDEERGERRDERELKAEDGEVGVAVGHRLHADLQDADHGQKGDEEPKPAGGEPGTAGALVPREESERGEQGDGTENDEQRPGAGMRIENGEIGGPEEFADVADAGDGGVGEAGGEREREGKRSEVRLHQNCHYRDDRREREKRDLLEDQRTPADEEGADGRVRRRSGGETLQRPDIEEQEDERQ